MMKRKLMAFSLLLILGMMSRVVANTPRNEYPRPQFERTEWINLNGTWSFDFDFGKTGRDRNLQASQGLPQQITVPFCPESSLSGIGHTDHMEQVWYQRKISIPAEWSGKKIFLNFGAVDYCAEIYIDGKFVHRHTGGSSSFAVDLSRKVEPGKTHNLVVLVMDDLRSGLQTGGKQSGNFYSGGCSYTRTTGIWQTVWMEAVAPTGLRSVFARPDIDAAQLIIEPDFYAESNGILEITLKAEGKVVAHKEVKCCNSSVAVLPVKKMKLWSPESPFLYDIEYVVKDIDGKVVDRVKSYTGMRKVHTEGGRFYLNNKPYFQRLVLDQGFYPDGIWTAPSDEALRNDIILSKEAGFNGARLHQKVFEERFYYWADKLGYLTWGEAASWMMDINRDLAVRNFLSEWQEIVIRDRNHPSLVIWTPMNESWGGNREVYVRMMQDIYKSTKALDPTRPINDASGGHHVMTDIWTIHNYEQDGIRLKEQLELKPGREPMSPPRDKEYLPVYDGQPLILDEFGGIAWMAEKDRKNSWGYGGYPENEEAFYKRLEGQIDAILASPQICGFCYTQLTDVEQEKNGIYYYNRNPKFDMKRIKSIFEKVLQKK